MVHMYLELIGIKRVQYHTIRYFSSPIISQPFSHHSWLCFSKIFSRNLLNVNVAALHLNYWISIRLIISFNIDMLRTVLKLIDTLCTLVSKIMHFIPLCCFKVEYSTLYLFERMRKTKCRQTRFYIPKMKASQILKVG